HVDKANFQRFSPACGSSARLIYMEPEMASEIVRIHNKYRDRVAHGMMRFLPPAGRMFTLVWDNQLARFAEYIAMECNLEKPDKVITLSYASKPGFNSACSKYPIGEHQDTMQIVRSQLKIWFDESRYIMEGDYIFNTGPNTKHFRQMMVGLNSHVGCAIAAHHVDNTWVYLMFYCLYGCSKTDNYGIYEASTYPGSKCICGINPSFRHLCAEPEHV
ncbi:hypothetical protein KR222_001626, partial [Zaprionus bogoriensis]